MMRCTADYGRPPSADDGATSKERSGRGCRGSSTGCASIIEVVDGGLRLRPRAGLRRQIWKLLSHCNVMQRALDLLASYVASELSSLLQYNFRATGPLSRPHLCA